MATATLTDAPDTITPARPLALLYAVERARRLALRHLEVPTPTPDGSNWRQIAEQQAHLATQATEALCELIEALASAPSR